jgi:hypothetical protein
MSTLAEITADLEKKTVPVLKDLLKGHHAEIKGLKADLVARLAAILASEASAKPVADPVAKATPPDVGEQQVPTADAAAPVP